MHNILTVHQNKGNLYAVLYVTRLSPSFSIQLYHMYHNLAGNHNEVEQMLNVQHVPCVAGCLCVKTKQETLASFTLPFACGDPAPILRTRLCVKVLDAERGEISLWR